MHWKLMKGTTTAPKLLEAANAAPEKDAKSYMMLQKWTEVGVTSLQVAGRPCKIQSVH